MIVILIVAAFIASLLTFFSGFGLATILTPIFIFYFPIDLAVAMTAIVHLSNNLFKLVLTYKFLNKNVIIKFGIPAVLAAFVGAYFLKYFSDLEVVHTYFFLGKICTITPLKIVISALMLLFILFDILPAFQRINFTEKYLPVGGVLSGFFGGLSGHQGALRSAFLIRLNLTKEVFIGTGVAIACVVDVVRLGVYSSKFQNQEVLLHWQIISAAMLSAFAGAYFGNKVLKKVTIQYVQMSVSIFLGVLALLIGAGII